MQTSQEEEDEEPDQTPSSGSLLTLTAAGRKSGPETVSVWRYHHTYRHLSLCTSLYSSVFLKYQLRFRSKPKILWKRYKNTCQSRSEITVDVFCCCLMCDSSHRGNDSTQNLNQDQRDTYFVINEMTIMHHTGFNVTLRGSQMRVNEPTELCSAP